MSNIIKELTENLLKELKLSKDDYHIIEKYIKKSYDSNANIINAIDKSFIKAKERNWECTYWFFDIHETIIFPNYDAGNVQVDFYPYAKEVLQILSKRKDIKMHLYTCSWPNEVMQYDKVFKENNIKFDYLNSKNPEVHNNKLGYYKDKPYFNVLLEDKAGFEKGQWKDIKEYLEKVINK